MKASLVKAQGSSTGRNGLLGERTWALVVVIIEALLSMVAEENSREA